MTQGLPKLRATSPSGGLWDTRIELDGVGLTQTLRSITGIRLRGDASGNGIWVAELTLAVGVIEFDSQVWLKVLQHDVRARAAEESAERYAQQRAGVDALLAFCETPEEYAAVDALLTRIVRAYMGTVEAAT